jgi:hypothetical protein
MRHENRFKPYLAFVEVGRNDGQIRLVCHGVGFYALAAALFAAHRFFVASEIAFLPAALIFRFGLAAVLVSIFGSPVPLTFAHRRRWPSLMRSKASGLTFRFPPRVPLMGTVAGAALEVPVSMARNSAIWASILCFCPSKPAIAAAMISFVNVGKSRNSPLFFKGSTAR